MNILFITMLNFIGAGFRWILFSRDKSRFKDYLSEKLDNTVIGFVIFFGVLYLIIYLNYDKKI